MNHPLHPANLWGTALIFLLLTFGLLFLLLHVVEQPERQPMPAYDTHYDRRPLIKALGEGQLQQALRQIQQAGVSPVDFAEGRMTGSPGFYRTERLIELRWHDEGLQVMTQEFPVVVPVTEYCEITDQRGRPLPDVRLYPFEPNGVLPIALPADGLSGPLVLTESTQSADLMYKPLEGSIVLNDGIDCSWPQLAGLGVKAVIVQENALANTGSPDSAAPWTKMSSQYDIMYPRFLARGPLSRYAGQVLRIRCKVTWQTKPVRNIVGILPGAHPGAEALVLNCPYDSSSIVPDQAPGAEQALSLASLLQLSQALAPYKGKLARDVIFVATAGHEQGMEGAVQLLMAFENISSRDKAVKTHAQLLVENERNLRYAQRALALLTAPGAATPAYWRTLAARLHGEDAGFRNWWQDCYHMTANELKLRCAERYLQRQAAVDARGLSHLPPRGRFESGATAAYCRYAHASAAEAMPGGQAG